MSDKKDRLLLTFTQASEGQARQKQLTDLRKLQALMSQHEYFAVDDEFMFLATIVSDILKVLTKG